MEKNAEIEDVTVDMGVTSPATGRCGARDAGFRRELSTLSLWMKSEKWKGFPLSFALKKGLAGRRSYIGESQNYPPYMGVSLLGAFRKSQQFEGLVHSFTQLSTVYRVLSTVFEILFHSHRKRYPHIYGVVLA